MTKEGLKPADEFRDNIQSFPSPKSITDIRLWYGAINQVSYSFAVSQTMLPFRQVWWPQIPFYWSDELENNFKSKEEINFKHKLLKFLIKPVHIPRKLHVVPDTFSGRSDSPPDEDPPSNVLPGYSDSMAPPDWVSSPILASTSDTHGTETESLIAGLAMSRLAGFNNLPETFLGHLSAPSIQAVKWSMLEAACHT